ncbi:adenylyl-sulfate kinase [Bradyrhizobium diazoefficiens]|nr:adenylyl-sulfate kinase [Bradyrhizobium diazoefficiens]MBR0701971.1 adenylyl-sulfate kinase [Bradyrhizobium diazoefficiens]MBR0770394.1 adenylyl-sulfate kinase [Bradyrhizobium diazoefficiens]
MLERLDSTDVTKRGRVLPIAIVGHVDHGKSTLIGRLLQDTGALPDGKVEALKESSRRRGMPFEWSFVMDALKAERDQGVTIDTARIRFRSEQRDYVIIDAPGHAEFLKNMLTGAAAAEAAVLVVDVMEGMSEQTRRHAFLLKLLGISEIIVVINKMDRCAHDRARFDAVAADVRRYFAGLGLKPAVVIPVSARDGDMLVGRTKPLGWYGGPTLVEALDAVAGAGSVANRPLRFPVQDVYKFDDRRLVVGRIEAGRLRVGDRLRFSPGDSRARIASIEGWNTPPIVTAAAGQSIGLTLDDEIFVERGQVASAEHDAPSLGRRFKLRVFYFDQRPLTLDVELILQIGRAERVVAIESIESVIDVNSLEARAAESLRRNDSADLVVVCRSPIAVDEGGLGGSLARGILRRGYDVVAAVVVEDVLDRRQQAVARTHVTAVRSAVDTAERRAAWGHTGGVVWLTGLSGAGKSTLARAVEKELFHREWRAVLLDADTLRQTLSADLGFSEAERAENVRRIGAVAQLLAESGQLAVVACIAPRVVYRERLRDELGAHYHEIYVNAPLDVCEQRDVKGLYAKAKRGEIATFTGLSDPYEPPVSADLELRTDTLSPQQCLERLLGYVDRKFQPGDVRKLPSQRV